MQFKKYLLFMALVLIILTSCHKNGNNDSLEVENITDISDIHSDSTEVQEQNNDATAEVKNELLDSQEKELDSAEEDADIKYNFTIKGESPDELKALISDNPIDLRHKELLEDYDGSSQMIIEVASKYEEFWNVEMEVAYNKLLGLLDENDRESLINSQSSWENYMESKKNIELSFFNEQKYGNCGTLREALAIDDNADETKARAYDLLEYLYFITGEINLVFSPDEW